MRTLELRDGSIYPAATPVSNYEHRVILSQPSLPSERSWNPKFDGPNPVIPLVDPDIDQMEFQLGVTTEVDGVISHDIVEFPPKP